MYRDINFLKFQKMFATNKKCQQYLFQRRWPNGFECPKCHGHHFSYISTREVYQCSQCRYQCSLKVGTIFEKSKTPLYKWFWMIFLLSQSKNGYSSLALQRLLDISYGTALAMSHKIRTAMTSRDSNYQLTGPIEMDDTFFGGKHVTGKRGRGAAKKATVIIGVQLNANDRPQYASMIAVEDLSEQNVTATVKEQIKIKSIIKSDAYSSYKVLSKQDYLHLPKIVGFIKNASKFLPWAHILISNAKALYRGTHHGVSKKHLQKYLSEFCYRFNRRFNPDQLFDRLIWACLCAKPIKIAELFG